VSAAVALALIGATVSSSSAGVHATAAGRVTYRHACATPTARQAACLAIVDSDAAGRPLTRAEATADDLHPYTAADLQAAYRLPSGLLGARQTIAIVDAYDDPNAEADLAVYRAQNGLAACTTGNSCFRKVNQNGGGTPPGADSGWAVEISLDLDMASAACPNCKLLLVEADDASMVNLGRSVDRAAKLKADVVSNSYGAAEYNTELADTGSHYNHPGVAVVASTGDGGFGVSVPAGLSTVVAVGGTSLYRDTSKRGWGETAWAGAGSGCGAYVAKPAWQHDRLCGKRAVADVSAVADPATPVAVYDTYDEPGWGAVGGTSVASPLLAGVFALAGNTATINAPAYSYSHLAALFDVTSGSNGACGGSYLCSAVKGYDGPTGNGTPNGIGAF
jgi:subtilase family serine protease